MIRKTGTDKSLAIRSGFSRAKAVKNPAPMTPPRTLPRLGGHQSPMARRSSAGGFSMLEVLIATLILSFGLLGTVGMQAAALKFNREARLQSVATTLAVELGEMMRGNKTIALRTSSNPYLGSFSSPLRAASPNHCLDAGSSCANNEDIAHAQMTDWLGRVDSLLPGAKVVVCFDDGPFDTNGIPRWNCPSSGKQIVVKIGWTKSGTDPSATGNAAFDRATKPSAVVSFFPGDTP